VCHNQIELAVSVDIGRFGEGGTPTARFIGDGRLESAVAVAQKNSNGSMALRVRWVVGSGDNQVGLLITVDIGNRDGPRRGTARGITYSGEERQRDSAER